MLISSGIFSYVEMGLLSVLETEQLNVKMNKMVKESYYTIFCSFFLHLIKKNG